LGSNKNSTDNISCTDNIFIYSINYYSIDTIDCKADFLQAIAEIQRVELTDELPNDNHYLVNEGVNDGEYEDTEQSSNFSDDNEL